MTATPLSTRRLLWVDPHPSDLNEVERFFKAGGLDLRLTDNFEAGLVELETWSPHLLLTDYTVPKSTMVYETFVHHQLPLVDPYRVSGPLADNPWQHKTIPILLVAGEPMVSTLGLVVPHLNRAAHFVPKPFDPSCLVSLVDKLLPKPSGEIVIYPDHGYVEVQGRQHVMSERRMDLLVTLARCYPRPLTAIQLARQINQEHGVFSTESAVRTAIHEMRRQLVVNDSRTVVDSNGRGYVLTFTPTLVSD